MRCGSDARKAEKDAYPIKKSEDILEIGKTAPRQDKPNRRNDWAKSSCIRGI